MLIQVLPSFPDDGAVEFTTQLDGVTYRFTVTFNDRSGSYYIDIATAEGARIASGLRVVCDWPIGTRLRAAGFPDGVILARSIVAGDDRDPSFGELGRRVRLVFIASSELDEPEAVGSSVTIQPAA